MNYINLPERIKEKILQSECEFVLTGGTGWVGRAILDALESVFQDDLNKKISVFGSSDREIKLLSGRVIRSHSLQNITTLNVGPKIFLHCAFLTRDRLSDLSVADFIKKNREISGLVLASVKNSDTRGLFSLSSGAVYRKNTRELETNWEKNSYGMCKIMDEQLFSRFTEEKSIPFMMPRLFNLSGAYINKLTTYALASMILSSLRHGVINIQASHQVIRSYISVDDLLSLVFSCIICPQPGQISIFDTAGDVQLELGELAAKIKDILKSSNVAISRPAMVEGEGDHYVGTREDLDILAGRHGIKFKPIGFQIENTVNYLRETHCKLT